MDKTWTELLVADHETTERVLDAAKNVLAGPEPGADIVGKLVDYLVGYVDGCHNKKEERHLFVLLEKRGVPRSGGPLAVMLSEHEQSHEILARLEPLGRRYVAGDASALPELACVLDEYASLVKAHFWKENDILYPMGQKVLGAEDAEAVVRGILAEEARLGPDTRSRYYAIADEIQRAGALRDLSYELPRDVLAAMLNTLPVELSFVDAEDRVRYFSHENQPKIFGRTRGAIGMPVRSCHPQKSLARVEGILSDFHASKRSLAEFWIDMADKKIHIRYFAVRDAAGTYLGCMEVVQDVTGIRRLEGQKRLLDSP